MKTLCCWAIQKVMPAYLEGRLSTSENRAIEKHLEACSHCKEQAEGLQSIHQLLSSTRELPKHDEIFWTKMEDEVVKGLQTRDKAKTAFRFGLFQEFYEDFYQEPVVSALTVLYGIVCGLLQVVSMVH